LKISRFLATLLRHPDLTPLDRARDDARAWLASMPDLTLADDAELLAFVSAYPQRLAASMKRLLHFSMIAAGPRALLDMMIDGHDLPDGIANRLVSGIDDVDSAALAQRQWSLGRIVAGDDSLMALFDEGLDGIEHRIEGTALLAPLEQFLADFGHRGNDEYELATPAWVMDPRPVFAAIERLRHAPPDRDPATATARLVVERELAETEVSKSLRWPRRSLAIRAAAVSRAGSIGRERAKDILVLENLGARLALYELARRAERRGGPRDHRLAFAVTADELPRFVADPAAFTDIIVERTGLEQYLNDREPPMWFEGTIPDPATWKLRAAPADRSTPPAGAELTGIAVSGGIAGGPAKVITDPGDPRGLEPGDILVCAITDPSWTPLFLVAAGVVCDTGAMQSHAAIVARELGIPAVMSVAGITTIADGTRLHVDGTNGTVRID
jgi:pyruvate,water dikinase